MNFYLKYDDYLWWFLNSPPNSKVQNPLRFLVPFLNSVKILLKVELLQYYMVINANSFFRNYLYFIRLYDFYSKYDLVNSYYFWSFFRFNSFLQIHIIELTFESMAIYARSFYFGTDFIIFKCNTIVGFLTRLIRPALHNKHNLFFGINSIKVVTFIM